MRLTLFAAVIAATTMLFYSIAKNTVASLAGVKQDSEALHLVQTIPLSGVKGRIDHMALDIAGQRLFVSALGNDTLEIVDLRSSKRIRSISGLHEPQDVYYVADLGKFFVSNGADGSLLLFDSHSFRLIGGINFHDDADNLRYDSRRRNLYVGYGNGALGIVDADAGKVIGDIRLAGHPEAFQLESAGPRIFVNVPSARSVAVIDRNKRSVIDVWQIEASGNFPMALDERGHRLFIGSRQPAKLLIYDTESGRRVTSVDIGGDVDDVFYDDKRKQLIASCGEGFVYIIRQVDANRYEVIGKMQTVRGARTSRYVPELGLLYLAVPTMAGQSAEIRVYSLTR